MADAISRMSAGGRETFFLRAAETSVVLTAAGARVVRRHMKGEPWDRATAGELRRAFETLGPTYVKFAQLIASSPGLFPEVLAEECRACLDHVRPVPFSVIERAVEDELGETLKVLFSRFDAEPLAAASIGQVHTAALPDGTEVVVKVQRPDIRRRLEGDLRVLHWIAKRLEGRSRRVRMANPVAVVEDFAENLKDDLNFIVAARSSERYAENLRTSGRADVRAPAIMWRWTSPRVLTMERVHGRSIADLDGLRAAGIDLQSTLRTIVTVCLESVLQYGFFHGDIHGGNLMVDNTGTVVMLDFGIVGEIDEKTRLALKVGLPALLVTRDYRAMAQMIGDLGVGIPEPQLDDAALAIEKIVGPALGATLAGISYGDVLLRLIEVGIQYGAQLPRSLVLVAKQFLYIERYAKAMAPDWSMFTDPAVLAELAG